MVVDIASAAGKEAAAQLFLFSCGLGGIDPVKFGTQEVEYPCLQWARIQPFPITDYF